MEVERDGVREGGREGWNREGCNDVGMDVPSDGRR